MIRTSSTKTIEKMATYRKKTLVEAFRYGHDNVPEWFINNKQISFCDKEKGFIETLEGNLRFAKGDYIIKNESGEIYPCKHHIFIKTYELA